MGASYGNRRLTPEMLREILMTGTPARTLAKLYTQHHEQTGRGTPITYSTIVRIRDGSRWSDAYLLKNYGFDRTGTLYDPNSDTAHPLAFRPPPQGSGIHRRRSKRWRKRPEYLTQRGHLRKGYELRVVVQPKPTSENKGTNE